MWNTRWTRLPPNIYCTIHKPIFVDIKKELFIVFVPHYFDGSIEPKNKTLYLYNIKTKKYSHIMNGNLSHNFSPQYSNICYDSSSKTLFIIGGKKKLFFSCILKETKKSTDAKISNDPIIFATMNDLYKQAVKPSHIPPQMSSNFECGTHAESIVVDGNIHLFGGSCNTQGFHAIYKLNKNQTINSSIVTSNNSKIMGKYLQEHIVFFSSKARKIVIMGGMNITVDNENQHKEYSDSIFVSSEISSVDNCHIFNAEVYSNFSGSDENMNNSSVPLYNNNIIERWSAFETISAQSSLISPTDFRHNNVSSLAVVIEPEAISILVPDSSTVYNLNVISSITPLDDNITSFSIPDTCTNLETETHVTFTKSDNGKLPFTLCKAGYIFLDESQEVILIFGGKSRTRTNFHANASTLIPSLDRNGKLSNKRRWKDISNIYWANISNLWRLQTSSHMFHSKIKWHKSRYEMPFAGPAYTVLDKQLRNIHLFARGDHCRLHYEMSLLPFLVETGVLSPKSPILFAIDTIRICSNSDPTMDTIKDLSEDHISIRSTLHEDVQLDHTIFPFPLQRTSLNNLWLDIASRNSTLNYAENGRSVDENHILKRKIASLKKDLDDGLYFCNLYLHNIQNALLCFVFKVKLKLKVERNARKEELEDNFTCNIFPGIQTSLDNEGQDSDSSCIIN